MASQPTILIICGSYCPCSLYSSLNTHLQSLGFDTYCKINPSCIDSPAPPTLPTVPAVSLTEDAEAVRESIRKLCGQQGRDVVLLAHSYGGMVATECLKGIGGGSVDGKGRVLGLVCVAAMLPMKGESVAGVCAEKALDFPFIGFEGDWLWQKESAGSGEAFYNDVPLEERDGFVKRFAWQSLASMTAEVTHEGWRDVPCGYIVLDRDQTFPPWLQREWTEKVEKETAKTVRVRNLDTAHCANVTAPDRLAEAVKGMVGDLIARSESSN